MLNPTIQMTENVTLVVLQNCPANLKFVSQVFERLAKAEVNVDMISQSPHQGTEADISFTVDDEELQKVLALTAQFKKEISNLRPSISSGNCKISVYDTEMKDAFGVAAKVFSVAAAVDTDIRMTTTSEVDISMLVTKADAYRTVKAIEESFK